MLAGKSFLVKNYLIKENLWFQKTSLIAENFPDCRKIFVSGKLPQIVEKSLLVENLLDHGKISTYGKLH